jgi:choline dehydrogenase
MPLFLGLHGKGVLMGYDFIVIGAGSAGCALAARLSENGAHRVLLLEAGGPDDKQEIHVPAAFSSLYRTEVDWAYQTEPQAQLNDRRLYWPRGKALGGSSSINAMIYQRGHRATYDAWAAAGNPGWSFEELRPFFLKSQHQERGASPHHGTGGPLNVADLRDPSPISTAFVEAAVQAGYPRNPDFNGAEQEGFGLYQVTQRGGMRCSAAVAFLHPALGRGNLEVKTRALATQLVIERGRCTGVRFRHDGGEHEAHAAREVVLCGGTVNSPQLLLLSGIGPAAHLRELGLEVQRDLPGVGANLQDHLAVPVAFTCTQPITLAAAQTPEQLARFTTEQRGMLTSNIAEAGGFLRISPATVPELQFHFAPGFFLEHGFVIPPGHGFSIGPTLVGVGSRGSLQLASTDPTAPPRIQPQYLTAPRDLEILVEGIRIARKIAAQPALAPYLGDEYVPSASLQSDADLTAFIRANAETLYHPVGTCKMGRDPDAVVDAQLRVHGIAGLRVADASIMPSIINANTNAPAIAIGEKAAALLLAEA